MRNYIVINEDDLRESYALILTLAAFFFNHNNKHTQEEHHNDFHEGHKD